MNFINILIVDSVSAYRVVLGKSALKGLGAIISIQLYMKFLIEKGMVTVGVDQEELGSVI